MLLQNTHINQVNVYIVRVYIKEKKKGKNVKTHYNNTILAFQVGRGQLKTVGYRKNKTVLTAS